MSRILGIGGFDHDGAVTLVEDGVIAGHVEWERVCRCRYAGLRAAADLDTLLQATGWDLSSVSEIAWADRERHADPACAELRDYVRRRFPRAGVSVIEHHLCHQASAFYPSGWPRAAILSVDGKGDGASAALAIGDGGAIWPGPRQPSASSVGRTWHALAIACGYPHFGAAGKVMALAAYGTPRHLPALLSFTELREDGTFSFTAPGEAINQGPTFRNAARQAAFFQERFAVPDPRGALPAAEHADLAASVQAWTDHVVGHMAAAAVRAAGTGRLCIAGGVGLNVLTNRHLLEAGIAAELFVQPAAGDCGLSLGAALSVARPERPSGEARFSPYLGREIAETDARTLLARYPGLRARRHDDPAARAVASLQAGELIGWVQERAEAGPRALGARSLLASPLHMGQRDRVNRIKQREPYRPVALSVLEPFYRDAFEGPACPYMLRSARARGALRSVLGEGLHVDGSSRLQLVDGQGPWALGRLLEQFGVATGVPALLNTSLNARGEPLVDTAQDALSLLAEGRVDRLFVGPLEIFGARG